jgi:hypothetical protein
VILFLSNFIYKSKIVKPAEKLVKIFPYYKHLSSASSSSSEDEKTKQKTKKISKKKTKRKPIYSSDTSVTENEKELDESFQRLLSVASNPVQSQTKNIESNKIKRNPKKNSKKKTTTCLDAIELDEEEDLNESFKRLLSITEDDNQSKKIKTKTNHDNHNILDDFFKHIPYWGGHLVDDNNNLLSVQIENTCTIDYLLLALWTSSKLSNKIICFLNETFYHEKAGFILNIIENIDSKNWNKAKSIWIQKIIKKEPIEKNSQLIISLWGNEYEFFLKFIYEFQNHEIIFECSSNCEKNLKKNKSSSSLF